MLSDIGLLRGFGEIASLIGSNFALGLLICWLITPGMMMVIAPIFESRWLPLSPSKQFLSFFPGDLFLGILATGLCYSVVRLPGGDRMLGPVKVNSVPVQLAILVIVAIVAIAQHQGEVKAGIYPRRAVNSPTKWYHDLVLYVGYGYLIVSTFITLIVAGSWGALWALCALPWVFFLGYDSSKRDTAAGRLRAQHAHVADWEPIWVY